MHRRCSGFCSCVGVPHLEWTSPEGRALGLFGREHLCLVKHHLHCMGLARNSDVPSEMSHAWRS